MLVLAINLDASEDHNDSRFTDPRVKKGPKHQLYALLVQCFFYDSAIY